MGPEIRNFSHTIPNYKRHSVQIIARESIFCINLYFSKTDFTIKRLTSKYFYEGGNNNSHVYAYLFYKLFVSNQLCFLY